MKLKNIILAFCAIAVFAACSDDNDGVTPNEAKATLSVKLASKALSDTSDPQELPGEANINTITTLVFNQETGDVIGRNTTTINTTDECDVEGVNVEELVPAKIVLIANASASAFEGVNNYAEFNNVYAELSNQSVNSLLMSTQVINTSSSLVEGGNYIGYPEEENINGLNSPLWLIRVPARLQVQQVYTRLEDDYYGNSVRIDEISFTNVKSQSLYFNEAEWGSVEANAPVLETNPTFTPEDIIINNDNPINDLGIYTYAMENTSTRTPTGIQVKATLLRSEAEGGNASRTFYSLINSIDNPGADHVGIKRNYVYNLSLGFTGSSFEGPGDVEGILDMKVSVEPWEDVQIKPEL